MTLMIWKTCSSISLKSKDGFGQEKKLEGQLAFFCSPNKIIKAGKRDKVPLYAELRGGGLLAWTLWLLPFGGGNSSVNFCGGTVLYSLIYYPFGGKTTKARQPLFPTDQQPMANNWPQRN
jgi:hypothetical protein